MTTKRERQILDALSVKWVDTHKLMKKIKGKPFYRIRSLNTYICKLANEGRIERRKKANGRSIEIRIPCG